HGGDSILSRFNVAADVHPRNEEVCQVQVQVQVASMWPRMFIRGMLSSRFLHDAMYHASMWPRMFIRGMCCGASAGRKRRPRFNVAADVHPRNDKLDKRGSLPRPGFNVAADVHPRNVD